MGSSYPHDTQALHLKSQESTPFLAFVFYFCLCIPTLYPFPKLMDTKCLEG